MQFQLGSIHKYKKPHIIEENKEYNTDSEGLTPKTMTYDYKKLKLAQNKSKIMSVENNLFDFASPSNQFESPSPNKMW